MGIFSKKHIQFLAVGDMVTDVFIDLKDATVNCEIDQTACKLCVNFGQKIPFESAIEVRAVGNSANAAVSASRLGLSSGLVATVGNDQHGKNCIETLKDERVSTKFVGVDQEHPTNYHYVLRYGAERTILIKHAPFNYVLPDASTEVDWVYFSSVGEHALPFHQEIAEWVKSRPYTKLAFQPGTFQIKVGAEALKDLYAITELFFCNLEEAQIILNTQEKDVQELIRGIHALGPKKVVITDGPKGLTASDGVNVYSLPMYPDPKEPVDRTGAGDATSSTITAMMALGMSFEEAIACGPVNSMSVVQYIGAREGLLSLSKLKEYLHNAPEEYKVKKV